MAKHRIRMIVCRMKRGGKPFAYSCMEEKAAAESPFVLQSLKEMAADRYGADNVREATISLRQGWMEPLFEVKEERAEAEAGLVGASVGGCPECPLKIESMGTYLCDHPSMSGNCEVMINGSKDTPDWCPLVSSPVRLERGKE